MNLKQKFILSIITYTVLSILSQYGSAITVNMSWLLAGAFLPLSCFTIIPLLDCVRSLSQGSAERAGVPFKVSFPLLVVVPLVIAFVLTLTAHLPPSIFVGAVLATGVGGLVDVLSFRFVGRFFKEDHKRMTISNALATVTGSFIFFMCAFTPMLEVVGSVIGIEFVNILDKGSYLLPAISSQIQAAVVYVCGLAIAWTAALTLNKGKTSE